MPALEIVLRLQRRDVLVDRGQRRELQCLRDLFITGAESVLDDELRDEVHHFLLSAS